MALAGDQRRNGTDLHGPQRLDLMLANFDAWCEARAAAGGTVPLVEEFVPMACTGDARED
jgi:hypothetical protein